MIAIVIDDLGIDQRRTKRAIALPAPLTLAFIPYGYNLRDLAKSSHDAGHELLVHVNMEPTDRGVDPRAEGTADQPAIGGNPPPHGLGAGVSSMALLVSTTIWGSRFTEWPDGMGGCAADVTGPGIAVPGFADQYQVGRRGTGARTWHALCRPRYLPGP